MQATEARMRRALGLDGEALRMRPPQERTDPPPRPAERFVMGGHKRRFVHDGEVPVTVVHGLVSGRREHHDGNGSRNANHTPPTNRLEVAEAALAAEIATRERIERALQEAQAAVRDLRTKLGHADLAHQETAGALQRERETVTALRVALEAAQAEASAARAEADAARQAEHAAAQAQHVAEQARHMAEHALEELRTPRPAPTQPVVVAEEEAPRPRRGRKPRAEAAAPAPAKPRKPILRTRTKTAAPAREPKPIRWWLTSRKKKR